MKTIGRRLLAYYAIFVIVLGGMLYFDGDLLPQTPVSGEPFSRLILVSLDALTFTGDGTAHALAELNQWASDDGAASGEGSVFLSLVGMLLVGYALFCVAVAPVYGYAYLKNIQRSWMMKFVSIHWEDARFRHLALGYSSFAVVLIAIISAFSAPHLVAACVTLGAFVAFRYPAPAAAILFVATDLYGGGRRMPFQNPPPPTTALNSENGALSPKPTAAAQPPTGAAAKNNAAPAQSTPKRAPSAQGRSWQDKLNQ